MEFIYILTVIKECESEATSVEITPYRNFEAANEAYSAAVDEARNEFGAAGTEDEVATDRYRYYSIIDNFSIDKISIELDAKVVHEEYIQGED